MLEKLFNISAIIKILKVGNFDVIQTNGGAKCHTSAYVMNFRALVPPAFLKNMYSTPFLDLVSGLSVIRHNDSQL